MKEKVSFPFSFFFQFELGLFFPLDFSLVRINRCFDLSASLMERLVRRDDDDQLFVTPGFRAYWLL